MNPVKTVEITAPDLPSPLPTDHQALMDVFYGTWSALTAKVRDNNAALAEGCNDVYIMPGIPGMMRSPTQDEIAAVMPAKVNAAVMLGNYNYQVGNGGHSQHAGNNYASALPALIQLMTGATALGIPQAAESLAILEEYAARLDAVDKLSHPMGHFADNDDDDRTCDDLDDGETYNDLDKRYYALDGEKLCQDVLDRFEECVLRNFGAAAFRKAA